MQAENGWLDRELRVVREKLGDFEKRAAGDAAFAASTHAAQAPLIFTSKSLQGSEIKEGRNQQMKKTGQNFGESKVPFDALMQLLLVLLSRAFLPHFQSATIFGASWLCVCHCDSEFLLIPSLHRGCKLLGPRSQLDRHEISRAVPTCG